MKNYFKMGIEEVKEKRKLSKDLKKLSGLKNVNRIKVISRGGKEELKRLIQEENFKLNMVDDFESKTTWVERAEGIPKGITGGDRVLFEVICFLKNNKKSLEEVKEIRRELEKVEGK